MWRIKNDGENGNVDIPGKEPVHESYRTGFWTRCCSHHFERFGYLRKLSPGQYAVLESRICLNKESRSYYQNNHTTCKCTERSSSDCPGNGSLAIAEQGKTNLKESSSDHIRTQWPSNRMGLHVPESFKQDTSKQELDRAADPIATYAPARP